MVSSVGNVRDGRIRAGSTLSGEPDELDFGPLCQRESIFHLHAKVADGGLDLGVSKQDLHRAQIACCLVDDGSLGPPERVRSVLLLAKAYASNPFVDQSRILPGADMPPVV